MSTQTTIVPTVLYALLSDQGTAMAETGICGACLQVHGIEAMRRCADIDYDGGPAHEVNNNEEISCNWCGLGLQD